MPLKEVPVVRLDTSQVGEINCGFCLSHTVWIGLFRVT